MRRKDTRYIVIHCAATRPEQDIGVKEIRKWHLARKFKDVGYHFVIRRSGEVERGRAIDEVGAHVVGYNHCSIGICLVGGIDEDLRPADNFTPVQMRALGELLAHLTAVYPSAIVVGHRDFNGVAKACPCFNAGKWWRVAKTSNVEAVNV